MKTSVKQNSPGNDRVVAGLERVLARARLGGIRAVGVVFAEHMSAEAVYFGDENARPSICFGIDLFKLSILNDVIRVHDPRQPPPANVVSYDFKLDPISFDFIPWLATAEMVRRRERAVAPLRVAFINPQGVEQRVSGGIKFIENVIRPALALFGAVEGVQGEHARHQGFAGLREVERAHAQGEAVPQLSVPEAVMSEVRSRLQGRQPVTFTFRETGMHARRNSDLEEWHKLAMWLCQKGEDVIIVRDTAKARESFPGFEVYPEASLNLHTRAALYSQAKCNLCVQNGPFALLPHTQTPWLMFASVNEDEPEECNRPDNWRMCIPTNAEGQLPWATFQQRIIYGPDKYDTMRTAYETLCL